MLRMLLVCKWTEQARKQAEERRSIASSRSNHSFDRRLLCNTSDNVACCLRFRVCFSFKSHTCMHITHMCVLCMCVAQSQRICKLQTNVVFHPHYYFFYFNLFFVSSILSFRFHLRNIYSTFALRFFYK